MPDLCYHKRTKKEYFNGCQTGDEICLICGKVLSSAELKLDQFNYRKEKLKERLVKIFDTEWLHHKMLKGHKWDNVAWNEGAHSDQLGMNVFYLLCHGPWLPPRIKQLENRVERVLNAPSHTFEELVGCYPLSWQKGVARCLKPVWDAPRVYGEIAHHPVTNLVQNELFKRLKLPRRYKVVDIWLGRNLGIPSFPIDRHIQRELDRLKLDVSYQWQYDEFLVALIELDYDPILLEWQLINSVKRD